MKKFILIFAIIILWLTNCPDIFAQEEGWVMSGDSWRIDADIFSNSGNRYLNDTTLRGNITMCSIGGFPSEVSSEADYELENGFEFFEFPKSVWQEKNITRQGPNSFGFSGDAIWRWQVPAKGNQTIYIDAYIRLPAEYPSTDNKPFLILTGPNVNSQSQPTETAYSSWEKLTLQATPSKDTILTLEVNGQSLAEDARFYIDDISVRN